MSFTRSTFEITTLSIATTNPRVAEHLQSIDLFRQFHRTEFGSQAGAGTAGNDQPGADRGEFECHGQGQRRRQILSGFGAPETDQNAAQVNPKNDSDGETNN